MTTRRLPFVVLCVDDGDAGEVDDVLHFVAALQHVDGLQRGDEVKDIVNLAGVAVVDALNGEG